MSPSNSESMRAKGLRNFQVWIPVDLFEAIKRKLYNDRRSGQAAMTKLLSLWAGWNPDDRKSTGTTNEPPAA